MTGLDVLHQMAEATLPLVALLLAVAVVTLWAVSR